MGTPQSFILRTLFQLVSFQHTLSWRLKEEERTHACWAISFPHFLIPHTQETSFEPRNSEFFVYRGKNNSSINVPHIRIIPTATSVWLRVWCAGHWAHFSDALHSAFFCDLRPPAGDEATQQLVSHPHFPPEEEWGCCFLGSLFRSEEIFSQQPSSRLLS